MNNPFAQEEFGVISPRTFTEYDSTVVPNDAEYFSSSILNSFPDLQDRARFLNKLYQCLLCHQLPHKVRKLVAVGAADSGKSSWSRIFSGLIPRTKIAVLTKEDVFGASMIEDDTELLIVDEWKKKMLPDDLLKTLLQGGYFAQAVKHGAPRMQEMNGGVYLTCNKVPDYGDEQVNIERRLYICPTVALPTKYPEAPRWLEDNAMQCLVWMATLISANVHKIEQEERFYELPRNIRSNAMLKSTVSQEDLQLMRNSTIYNYEVTLAPDTTPRVHPCFAQETEHVPGKCAFHFFYNTGKCFA